jgi:hypothetical protein
MPLNRMIAPPRAASPIQVFGNSYVQAPGTVVDVPSGHTATLAAAGWTYVALSGATSQRPTQGPALVGADGLQPGLEFYDLTLGKCIFFDGLVWRDPATGAAV